MRLLFLLVFLTLSLTVHGKVDMVSHVKERVERINSQLGAYDSKFFKVHKFSAKKSDIWVDGRTPVFLAESRGAEIDHFQYITEQVCFHWGLGDLITDGIQMNINIWDNSNRMHQLIVNLNDCTALTSLGKGTH